MRFRLALVATVVAYAMLAPAREGYAAPEVRKFNLVVSAIPLSIESGGVNDVISQYNEIVLAPRNLKQLDAITFGWMFDAELRYLVRPNLALDFGVGHFKTAVKREYLPLINQTIDVRAEVLTVPVHVGADYYFAPYTQGDFQARAFFGGGVISSAYSNVTLQQSETNTGPSTTLGGSFNRVGTRDGPGFYLQGGAHMFFATRYSVLISLMYRDAKIVTLLDRDSGQPVTDLFDQTVDLDLKGFGARLGLAIGL